MGDGRFREGRAWRETDTESTDSRPSLSISLNNTPEHWSQDVSLIARVPNGERWIHEIKFDGYRVQLW